MRDVVVGKKLVRPGDEPADRSGVSFEAFKLPEPAEGEEPPAEDAENPVEKPPPVPVPLVIDNVMRDKRVRFFGVPKIGSFAAIPLSYASLDHDTGCVLGGAEPYTMNKVPTSLILSIDTIGRYRELKVRDAVPMLCVHVYVCAYACVCLRLCLSLMLIVLCSW